MRTYLFILIIAIVGIYSKGLHKKESVNKIEQTLNINKDSLIIAINKYAVGYFESNSIESIIAKNGKPNKITKIQWGDNEEDSLLTFNYNFLKFNFYNAAHSKLQLESVYLFDKNVHLAGNITIGNTTRQDIINKLGLPDADHNDPGRSMTKSGDKTVYGTKSGAGDTVTFIYYINIDEIAIGLGMTKDTLRKITWSKNLL